VGLGLVALSFLLGWPTIALLGLIAAGSQDAWIVVVGGPTTYAVSWVMLGIGVLLAGRDATRTAARRALSRARSWRVRRGDRPVSPGRGALHPYREAELAPHRYRPL
jgi:hypothetical protein